MATREYNRGFVDPFWDDEYVTLDYINEPFNNARDMKNWRLQGFTHEHYTGNLCDMRNQQPSWNNQVIDWAEREFGLKDVGTAYYNMETGVILPLHGDTYKAYRARFECKLKECYRVLVFLRGWSSGHYFEIAGDPITKWEAGDWIGWSGSLKHMAANLGTEPRYTLQITGHR